MFRRRFVLPACLLPSQLRQELGPLPKIHRIRRTGIAFQRPGIDALRDRYQAEHGEGDVERPFRDAAVAPRRAAIGGDMGFLVGNAERIKVGAGDAGQAVGVGRAWAVD